MSEFSMALQVSKLNGGAVKRITKSMSRNMFECQLYTMVQSMRSTMFPHVVSMGRHLKSKEPFSSTPICHLDLDIAWFNTFCQNYDLPPNQLYPPYATGCQIDVLAGLILEPSIADEDEVVEIKLEPIC